MVNLNPFLCLNTRYSSLRIFKRTRFYYFSALGFEKQAVLFVTKYSRMDQLKFVEDNL